MATFYEHTNMYMSSAEETVITYPARVSVQMIILYFHGAHDNIKLTDGISGHVDETADDTILDLYGGAVSTIVIDWSAKPRHFHGLKVATIEDSDCKVYIYLA